MIHAQYNRLGLPVTASNREVVKAAHKLLAQHCRRAYAYRDARHAWLRSMLNEHAEAFVLFAYVMGGRG